MQEFRSETMSDTLTEPRESSTSGTFSAEHVAVGVLGVITVTSLVIAIVALAMVSNANSTIDEMQKDIQKTDRNDTQSGTDVGTSFTRWGRADCPATTELIYKGIVGGAKYSESGSGSNYLCLPEVPIYEDVRPGVDEYMGTVWAGEYEACNFGPYMQICELEPVCSLCRARGRSMSLMIPARNDCPSQEWTLEYKGYLVATYYGYQKTQYVCLDADAEGVPGSMPDHDGALFYAVQGRCSDAGGLPCPPYVDGHELTCAVCTL